MKKQISNTKFLLATAAILLIAVFGLMLFTFFNLGTDNDKGIVRTGDFSNDYSNIDKLEPGETTIEEAVESIGEPASIKAEEGRTELQYNTPNTSLKNEAVYENDSLKYTTEYVFSPEHRGTYNEYTSSFGDPQLILYSKQFIGVEWAIFLDEGIGVENSNNEIGKILRFVPQGEEEFKKNFLDILNAAESIEETYQEDDHHPVSTPEPE